MFPLRQTVDGLIDGWLAENPREGYELVVAHTHAHGDHVAGDGQFAGRPLTTVVGTRGRGGRRVLRLHPGPPRSCGSTSAAGCST